MSLTVKDLCERSYTTAKAKGWWEEERTFPEVVALMHSELSEALEAFRSHEPPFHVVGGKPEGMLTELADVVIRIADYCGRMGWDLETVLQVKMDYNETRPHRHGGKAL